jgi:guanylate kinase
MKKGQIVLFVGPTCVGKTTLIEALQKEHFADSGVIVSLTTRARRPWEKDGVDYLFVSEEEFLRGKDAGEYYEWVKRPDGVNYASSQAQVRKLLDIHPIVFGALDIEGCERVKEMETNALVIFLYPDDMAHLEERIRLRGDLSEEKIKVRLAIAEEEMHSRDKFDEAIENVNGKFAETVTNTVALLRKHGI